MALLFDEDYEALKQRGIPYEEDEASRFFLFTRYTLPIGLYTIDSCDVLVVIPANYNQEGNDMLWTFPRLYRGDSKDIPNVSNPGPGGDNRICKGREFCRWSRHYNFSAGHPSLWRPGRD